MVEIVVALICALAVVAVVQTICKAVISWRMARLAIETESHKRAEVLKNWPLDVNDDTRPAGVNGIEPHRRGH